MCITTLNCTVRSAIPQILPFVVQPTCPVTGMPHKGETGWYEDVIFTDDLSINSLIKKRFQILWRKSYEITPALLEECRKRYAKKTVSTPHKSRSLIEAIENNSNSYDGKISFVFYQTLEAIPKEATKKIAGRAKDEQYETGHLDCFFDWEELPLNQILICFELGPNLGMKHDGNWRVVPNNPHIKLTTSKYESMTFVENISDKEATEFLQAPMSSSQCNNLIKAYRENIKARFTAGYDYAVLSVSKLLGPLR